MKYTAIALLTLSVSACQGDETLSGYGAAERTWVLQQLDGYPFSAPATLSFPAEGQMTGNGPCNRFSAGQSAPYPWFQAGPIAATKRACRDLKAEAVFFSALAEMTQSEVLGATLVLRNDAGREMVFTASD